MARIVSWVLILPLILIMLTGIILVAVWAIKRNEDPPQALWISGTVLIVVIVLIVLLILIFRNKNIRGITLGHLFISESFDLNYNTPVLRT